MTDTTEKALRGRPPVTVDAELLREMARAGLSIEDAADAFGISRRWFFDEQNRWALEIFRQERAGAKLRNNQRVEAMAIAGNMTAIKLLSDIFERSPRDVLVSPSPATVAGNQLAPVSIDSVNDLMSEQRALIEGWKG